MKRFIYKTTVEKAIDNFNVEFISNLEPLDVLSLINKHNKYEFSLTCDNMAEKGMMSISKALKEIDKRTLHKYEVYVTPEEKLVREDVFGANSCKAIVCNGDPYYEIDLSMDEFKALKVNTHKVKAEMCSIMRLIDFLGSYEVVYGDSRAKLRFPRFCSNQRIYVTEESYGTIVYPKSFNIKIKEVTLREEEELVEVKPIVNE